MGNYVVRISADDAHEFEYIDFSQVSKGILTFKVNRDYIRMGKDNKFGLRYNIKIDCFINRSESVGMVILPKKVIEKVGYSLQLTRYDYKNPIEGTIDYFNPIFESKLPTQLPQKGEDILMVRFLPKRYHKLLIDKDTEGIQPSPVEIQIYLNGEFKPHSISQAKFHQLELVEKSYGINPKFYDLSWVDYLKNNFDENGMDRPEPLVRTLEPEPYFI